MKSGFPTSSEKYENLAILDHGNEPWCMCGLPPPSVTLEFTDRGSLLACDHLSSAPREQSSRAQQRFANTRARLQNSHASLSAQPARDLFSNQ